MILALDLYFQHRPDGISQTHPAVAKLSEVLNRLHIHSHRPDQQRFRNANGVYMKLCNFLRFDPSYAGKGLRGGGADEETVWKEFVNDRARLHAVAEAIRRQVGEPSSAVIAPDDGDIEAPEGRILLRQHKVRERDPSLVRRKKQNVFRSLGCLKCEVCDFDFRAFYGELGDGFIECHHSIPVSQLRPGQKTRLKDLRLVCANCHRMLHRGGETMTVEALRTKARSHTRLS